MLREENKRLIADVLNLFGKISKTPITFYERDGTDALLETVRSDERYFPEYCHAIWRMGEGRGRRYCMEDMCARAAQASRSLQTETRLCHAGLTNISTPVIMKDEHFATLQYGAFLLEEESIVNNLAQHRIAMSVLGASEQESARLQQLFHQTAHRHESERKWLHEDILPLLMNIIYTYITQVENRLRINKGAFHDLQLQLQAALAQSEAQEERFASDTVERRDQEELTGAIESSATVLYNLTGGNYLGEYHFHRRRIDEIVNRAILQCRGEARRKDIRIIVDLQSREKPVFLEVSERHIQVVFNNAIQNAVKYSYHTSQSLLKNRYVYIRGKTVREGYEFEISNYGVGIDPDELSAVLEEGVRGRQALREGRTGSGLGLPMIKMIVERHQGYILLASNPISEVLGDKPRPYITRLAIWLPFKQQVAGG